ncbi:MULTISPECIES: plasmid mobilization protein [Floridanema]|uniref:Mobilization protein n=2 Tax=Floridanema TaxID=3396149 RepID=A0ABV4X8Y3_9CYAN
MPLDKRTTNIIVRLTPKEKSLIEKKAAAAAMTLSDYIRHCVERRTFSTPIPEINRLTYHQLAKVALSLSHAIVLIEAAKISEQNLSSFEEVRRTTVDTLQVVRSVQSQLLGLKSSEELL